MVWNRILRRKKSFLRRLHRKQIDRALQFEGMEKRELLAVDIGAIAGVTFVDQNGTGSSTGNPPVLVDGNGDLVAPGTAGATGIQITLYDDTNTNGSFDAGIDLQRDSLISNLDGTYRFDDLPIGQYFLEQQSVPQLTSQPPVAVQVINAEGSRESMIDDYSLTSQTAIATTASPVVSDTQAAPEVIGGHRDVRAEMTSASGAINVLVDSNPGTLSIGSTGAEGTALIQYDGADGSINLDTTGLAGASLAGGNAGDPIDPNTGLVVSAFADLPGDQLVITVYSDAANFSTATVNIDASPTPIENLVPFSGFQIGGGLGADFNNVGAIEATVALSANTDVVVSIVESRSPEPVAFDFANSEVFDLSVQKSAVGTAVAGDILTYEITVGHEGSGQADNVLVTDTLDDSLNFVSFNAGDSNVTFGQPNGQELEFNVGSLQPGETETFSFNVLVDSSATGQLDNTAVVTSSGTDTNPSNNSSTETVTLQSIVDLVLTKEANLQNVIPGQGQVEYTFTISHAPVTDTSGSFSDATNVVVQDVIPLGLTQDSITAPGGTTSFDPVTRLVTVQYDTIPIGETREFTVVVDVDETALGSITNGGSVTSSVTDFNPGDNSDSATVTANPVFDLSVTKAVDLSTPSPTDTITYTVEVENTGPSAAQGVVLTDTIPAGLTFVSGAFAGQAASDNGTTVSFPPTTISGGATLTATLEFVVDNDANGVITNIAQVPDLTASGEQDATNNSGSVDINVVTLADLQIEKTVSTDRTLTGSDLIYGITVTNLGPSPAFNVQVVDTLPSGVTFTSGTGPNGEVLTASAGTVTFDAGQLDSGASFQMTINATLNEGVTETQTNFVTVSSQNQDSNPNNNSASATTSIDPASASFSGLVFLDINNNGEQDANEPGLSGVTLTLTGEDFLGNLVNESVFTDSDGRYQFIGLAEGTYRVDQSQPETLRNGLTLLGTGATAEAADNVFLQIALEAEATATEFNFSELPQRLSKRRFLASSGSA